MTRRYAEIVPWAWGLNGAASVMGSVVSMAVALHLGFTSLLVAGGAVYLLALLAGLRGSPPDDGAADAQAPAG